MKTSPGGILLLSTNLIYCSFDINWMILKAENSETAEQECVVIASIRRALCVPLNGTFL